MTSEPSPAPARPWVPRETTELSRAVVRAMDGQSIAEISSTIEDLITQNHRIHDAECVNLDPASNTMSPAAHAALGSDLGNRPSLGYPGAKYEPGLEAIERIEIMAAELASRVFGARYVEVRVPSGSIANLSAFIAGARPEDPVIVPPPTIGGHVTHNRFGAAGLYGLEIHEAPIDPSRYTIDAAALADLAEQVRPKVISVGGSLNLMHHPVRKIREIADQVGALVLFDAAHLSGPIAGGVWPNPLAEGAHLMTMSTYKSLGGPPSGLLLTNEPHVAERIEQIAFPGLTANFDAGKTAAVAFTLLDWLAHGRPYAAAMVESATALAHALAERGVPVFSTLAGPTQSHAFAVDASTWDGGTRAAARLRRANLLSSSIGLPHGLDAGLRLGTSEIVRWGATSGDMAELASLIADGLVAQDPSVVAASVTAYRSRFSEIAFVH
jgi:glycine hydroxymethyltransferase